MSRDLSQVLRVGSLRFSVTAAQRVMVWKIRVLVAVHKVSDVWASPGLERTLFTGRHVGECTDAAGICDHHRRWKPGGVGILGRFLLVCVHV